MNFKPSAAILPAFLFLLTFATKEAKAQKDARQKQDTVRWFVGHWINKNTFAIDSTVYGKGGGGTISVKPNGTFEVSTPESKEFAENMSEAVNIAEKEEKSIADLIKAEEGLNQFTLVDKSVKELEKIKKDFKEAATEKQVPAPLSDMERARIANVEAMSKNCRAMEPEYHRIINFYEANKADKHPHFDLPPPPVADYFTCWGFDTAKQNAFDTASADYDRNFFKELRHDVNFLLANIQQMEAMGITNVNGIGHEQVGDGAAEEVLDNNPKHRGACAYIDYFKMSLAYDFYMKRGGLMAEQLWKDNRKNYGALKPVMGICLAMLEQKIAMNGSYDNGNSEMEILARPFEELYDTLSKLMIEERDYRLIGDIPLMAGLLINIDGFQAFNSNLELIHSSKTPWKPKHGLEELIQFPRFLLTVELDTKVGERGVYNIVHFKSQSKVITELDAKDGLRFTLAKVEDGKIKANILANESISPGPPATYVGTKIYSSQLPIFKIKLCKMDGVPEGDSIYLSTFKPMSPGNGNWMMQGKAIPLAINNADRLFINTAQLTADVVAVNPKVNQEQLEAIKEKALAMAAKMRAAQGGGTTDPKKMAEMMKEMINNNAGLIENQTAELMRIRLPLKVSNRANILVKQRFDAKELNPSFAQPIVYGYLTITLEHNSGGNVEN